MDVIKNKNQYSKIYYVTDAKPGRCNKCQQIESSSTTKIERISVYDWEE